MSLGISLVRDCSLYFSLALFRSFVYYGFFLASAIYVFRPLLLYVWVSLVMCLFLYVCVSPFLYIIKMSLVSSFFMYLCMTYALSLVHVRVFRQFCLYVLCYIVRVFFSALVMYVVS